MDRERSLTFFHLDDGTHVVVRAEWECDGDIDLKLHFTCDRPLDSEDWRECMRHLRDWASAHVDVSIA